MADEMLDHDAKVLSKCVPGSHGKSTIVLDDRGQEKKQSIAARENPKISAAIPLEVHLEGELDWIEDDLDDHFEKAEDRAKRSKVSLPDLVDRYDSSRESRRPR